MKNNTMMNIVNHVHYYNYLDQNFKDLIVSQGHLCEPLFIGQGCTERVGSDSYGYYIVDKKSVGRKVVWGLVDARVVFGTNGWTDGSQFCSLPNNCNDPKQCRPTRWIVKSGVFRKTKVPKFYFCDENGKKYNGRKCTYSFDGAYAYQDPSF